MKKLYLSLLFICFFHLGHSQTVGRIQADSLYVIGMELFKNGHYKESAVELALAQDIARVNPGRESRLYGDIVHYLGTDYQALRRFTEASKLLLEALEIRQKVLGPDHPDCGKTLNNLALANIGLGNLGEAEGYALKALYLKKKNHGEESLEYSNSQYTLAQVLEKKGAYASADSILTTLLELRERLLGGKTNLPYAKALNFKAGLESSMYQFEQAKKSYEFSLETMKELRSARSLEYLSVYLNLGQLYAQMGSVNQAETTQRDCLQLVEDLLGKEVYEYAISLRNLAFILQTQGRFQESLPILIQAQMVFLKIFGPDSPEAGQILGNLAASYFYTGNSNQAARCLEEEIAIFEKSAIRDIEYYRVLLNLGMSLINSSDYKNAEKYLLLAESAAKNQALPLEKLVPLHHNFGRLYLSLGKPESAEQYLLKAVNALLNKRQPFIGDDISVFFSLVELYQNKGNFTQTLHYAQSGQYYMENSIARAFYHLSEKELNEASTFYFKKSNRLYVAATFWNKPLLNAICYDNILFTKGYMLDNAIKMHLDVAQANVGNENNWLLWKSLNQELYKQYTTGGLASDRMARLEKEANLLEKKIKGATVSPHFPHWQDIQKELRQGEAALEFIQYQTSDSAQVTYAAMILLPNKKSKPLLIPLTDEGTLKIALTATPQNAPTKRSTTGSRGPTLFDIIWRPLARQLKGVKTVYLSPTGLLHRVNFSALAISDKKVLADQVNIIQLTSTRQLVERSTLREKPGTNPNDYALFLGGIRYETDTTASAQPIAFQHINSRGITLPPDDSTLLRGNDLSYLPASVQEVDTAAFLSNQAKVAAIVWKGHDASEANLMNLTSSPKIFHAATHGYFFPDPKQVDQRYRVFGDTDPFYKASDNPMLRSGILLAGCNYAWKHGKPYHENQPDGILTAYEVTQLDLRNTELVVLSACETGLGDISNTEGVYGLQRAFKIAGARYLLMSLWKVPDEATQDMMTTFYHYYLTLGMEIPEAFHRTQKDLRAKHANPYFWGAWILVE